MPGASSRSPPRVPNSAEDSHSPGVLLVKPRASPVCLRTECDHRFQSAEWTVQTGRREVRSHDTGRLPEEPAFQHAAKLGTCDLHIQLAMEQFGSGHQPLR